MTPRRKLILAAAACGACCSVPLLVVPALTALGFSGASAAAAIWAGRIETALAIVLAAAGGIMLFLWLRRRLAARRSCMVPARAHSGRAPSSA